MPKLIFTAAVFAFNIAALAVVFGIIIIDVVLQ